MDAQSVVDAVTGGTPKPDPETMRRAWVSALRSGQFKQTHGALCRKNEAGDRSYCCLGVACEVARLAGFPIYDDESESKVRFNGEGGVMPQSIQSIYGLSNCSGHFGDDWTRSLVGLNDGTLADFKEIADVIESRPAGLFTN